MAKVFTVHPNGFYSENVITDVANDFLKDVYELIGNGCDFVQAVNLGDGLYMLVDEEPFRRDPAPEMNPSVSMLLMAMGNTPIRIQGAAVFVGETRDKSDLAGLSDKQVAMLTERMDH